MEERETARLVMTVLMTPDMANFSGNVHGGALLNLLDRVAFSLASRYSQRYAVTLSVEALEARLVLANPPVAYWAFDNAAALGEDSGPNNNTLSPVGAAAHSAAGKSGGALSLNGLASYLSAASFPGGVPTGSSAYTISSWIKPAQTGTRGIVGCLHGPALRNL